MVDSFWRSLQASRTWSSYERRPSMAAKGWRRHTDITLPHACGLSHLGDGISPPFAATKVFEEGVHCAQGGPADSDSKPWIYYVYDQGLQRAGRFIIAAPLVWRCS